MAPPGVGCPCEPAAANAGAARSTGGSRRTPLPNSAAAEGMPEGTTGTTGLAVAGGSGAGRGVSAATFDAVAAGGLSAGRNMSAGFSAGRKTIAGFSGDEAAAAGRSLASLVVIGAVADPVGPPISVTICETMG
jgi:hypothetical protein